MKFILYIRSTRFKDFLSWYDSPAGTRRYFNVHTMLYGRNGCQMNVVLTLCASWVTRDFENLVYSDILTKIWVGCQVPLNNFEFILFPVIRQEIVRESH